MKMKGDDEVISIDVARDELDLLLITESGFGKRVAISEYPRKGRATQGVITFKGIEARGRLVSAMTVRGGQGIMLITSEGTITRQPVDQISRYGRPAQGVTVMKLRPNHKLVAVARVVDAEVVAEAETDDQASMELTTGTVPALDTEGTVDAVTEEATEDPADAGSETEE
jgi:DNA gyrase subunit A